MKPWRVALAYMAFSALALALFAIPVWHGWRVSVGTLRVFVPEEMQALPDLFRREGAAALAAAIRSRADPSGKEVIVFAGPGKEVLAGTMRRWPDEIPDAPGTYGHVIDLGDGALTRVVVSQVPLPDGYQLIIGRQSAGLMSMEGRFWYGMAAAMAIVLALGTALAWLLARRAEAMRESEQRYERAMVASNAGLWEWDAREDKYYLSARHLELLGFPPDTVFAGREDFLRRAPFHAEDREKWKREIARVFSSGGTHLAHELRVIIGEQIRWVRVNAVCFRDDQGKVARLTGSVTDVTERKLAEEASRASEERYSLAMEAAEEGHFDLDLDTDEVFVSERLDEIHGFAPGTRLLKRSEYFKQVRFYGDDEEKYYAAVRAAEAKDAPALYEFEFRILRPPSGELRWLRIRGKVTRDAEGRARRRTGVVADITAAKQAVEALRLSEERHSLALEASEEGHFDVDLATNDLYISERMYEIFAYPPGTRFTKQRDFMKQFPFYGNDGEKYWSAVERAMVKGGPDHYEFEFRIVRPSGEMRWIWTRAKIARDAQGNPVRRTGMCRDITESKLAEQALRKGKEALRHSEQGYELAMEAAQDAHWDWDMVGGQYYLSPRVHQIYGVPVGTKVETRADVLGLLPYAPEENERWTRATAELFAGTGDRLSMEQPAIVRGEIRWIQRNGVCVRDASGKPIRWSGSARDVTDRRRAENALRLSEERHALALEVAEEGHLDWNLETDEFFASDQAKRVMNVPPDVDDRTRDGVMGRVPYHPEDAERVSAAWRESLAGRGAEHELGYRIMRDGEPRWIHARWKIFRDADGKPQRVIGVVSDMTERKRVLETLRESEARFRTLVELNSSGFWEQDEDLRYLPSSFGVDIGGYATDERVGKTRWELSGDPLPLSGSWAEHQADLAARRAFRDFEYRRIRPDGHIGYYSASGAPIFDERGRFKGYYGVAGDITQRKRIEEELRRAQRLESMGTLAGGIAHDFNNILGAILGYGEMAMRNAKQGTRLRRDLDSIMVAGERGRALVDRVLAFSRSAVGERVPVRVEEVVREALDLVSARLPPKVKLHARLRAGGAALLGDATQVHQVLTNLATNAIQAMPAGGTLRVSLEAARIEAARETTIGALAVADYLVLAVADTGSGIEPETLERIFDPFFTTKEVGTGTGLGLSLVHGIVTDLGGAIDVATRVGKGTTFTVYLPRSGEAPPKIADERRPLPRGDGERVLVVDDEEPLVRLATETLESLGYAPVGFTSSVNALQEFGANPGRFDAILTDERMPGVTGSAIIRAVRRISPTIPILLMTGFAGGAAAKARELGANDVLKKPLLARELATSLARVLRP